MDKISKVKIDYPLLFPSVVEVITIYKSCPAVSEKHNDLSEAINHINSGTCEFCSYNVRVFKDFSKKF